MILILNLVIHMFAQSIWSFTRFYIATNDEVGKNEMRGITLLACYRALRWEDLCICESVRLFTFYNCEFSFG